MTRFSAHNISTKRDLHISMLVLYFVFVGITAMLVNHPLYLATLFLAISCGMCLLGGFSSWKKSLMFSFLMSITLVLVNILISRNGNTVLFESKPFPVYGKVLITHETLLFSLTMSLKLVVVIILFSYYELLVARDRSFSFFARFFPTSALVVVLSSLMLPQMRRRLSETHMVQRLRGASLKANGLRSKVVFYYPLLRIQLLSSLEDSWATAEALHARGFGCGRRSNYVKERFGRNELLCAISLLFSSAVVVYYFSSSRAAQFFPLVEIPISVSDILSCGVLLLSLLILPALNRKKCLGGR